MRDRDDPVRVLHVDDDGDFAELTAAFLSREIDRIEVVTAADVDEALATLTDAVDCVVSDYDMPGRNGIEFLEAVRAEHPDLPFILFTAKGSEEVASRAISAGVTDYLQKGSGSEQYAILANRIENAVSRCLSDRELRQWKQAIETATEGIAIVDAEGRYLQMNAAYADVYDASPADLVGRDWRERYPADEVDRFESEVLPRLRREGEWSGEAEGRRVDGTPIEESVSLSSFADGGHVRILRDVTEQKRHERDLQRYERIVETVGEGVYVLDDDLRFVFVNRAMATLTGLDREELLGSPLSRVVDTDGTTAGRDARAALLGSDHDVETVEADLRTAGDDPIHCEFRFTVFPSERGVHTVGVVRDVSDRRAYETELEAVRDRMEFALDATDSIIYEVDIETGRQTRHGPFERLYGLPSADLPTTEAFYDRAIHPADRDTIEAARRRFLTSPDECVEYEYRTHPDAGPVRWIRSEAYVHAGPTGDPTKLVGLATDITPLKRREQELERRNERLDEFVSVASHDLRNPLNVAIGALELLREDCDCDCDHLDTVERAHERMVTLVEDLLTLSRGGERVETEPLELATLAERCWGTVETDQAALEIDVPADYRIRADASRVRQLLANLLSNAVEHGSTSPHSRGRGDAVEHGSTSPRSQAPEDSVEQRSTSNRTAMQSGDAVEHGSTSSQTTRSDDAVEHGSTSAATNGSSTGAAGSDRVTITIGVLDVTVAGDGTEQERSIGGFYVEDDGPGIPATDRDRVFEGGYSTTEDGTGLGLRIVREVADAHGWDVAVTDGTDGGARFEVTGVELVE
ncbi:PAS domain S-box protein [Salinigranum sp. GCM10025319]|uniref:PAS domain S-box protein n=1 Tax=Salinigranum sp. GCM10025319 TaxID=3252687 RepID=UPI00361FD5C9